MTLDPRQFLSEPEELHALTIGLCEVICPWRPILKPSTDSQLLYIFKEYHYYMLGRALGILALVAISCAIKKLFF